MNIFFRDFDSENRQFWKDYYYRKLIFDINFAKRKSELLGIPFVLKLREADFRQEIIPAVKTFTDAGIIESCEFDAVKNEFIFNCANSERVLEIYKNIVGEKNGREE